MFSRSLRQLTKSKLSFNPFQFKSFHIKSNLNHSKPRSWNSLFLTTTTGMLLGYSLLRLWPDNRIHCDVNTNNIDTIQPKTKVSPFPKHLSTSGSHYSILGIGVKSVSFLSFHVYAVGIYLADEDRQKVKTILTKYGDDIETQLLDPTIGSEIISNLLNNGVKILLRIVPVRNTDFGHLRDGFVRSLTAQPRFKQENQNPEFGEGINELRQVFGRKLSVKKDTILHLLRDSNGEVTFSWFKNGSDTDDKSSPEILGKVTKPVVTELLFTYYLGGKKVSCEDARRETVKSLAGL